MVNNLIPSIAIVLSLTNKRVVIVGAGGLGGPISYGLATCAYHLTLCDNDTVTLSNLHRQIQFQLSDIGTLKTTALCNTLIQRGINTDRLIHHAIRCTADNTDLWLDGADLIIDASDNFETKFMVNDLCVAAQIPCLITSSLRYCGQILAVIPGKTGCYRCLFEAPPHNEFIDNCNTGGIVGAVLAIVAGIAVQQAQQLLTNDYTDAGTLFHFDNLEETITPRKIQFEQRHDCLACGDRS